MIPVKTKQATGDIPFVMKFAPVSMPEGYCTSYMCNFYTQSGTPSELADKDNNQPHVVVQQDEYDQYFLTIEQSLVMESRDVAGAVFFLLASHYVFNLSYHSKCADLLTFLQERVAKIPSFEARKKRKEKSPVALSHVNGITRVYNRLMEAVSDVDMDY